MLHLSLYRQSIFGYSSRLGVLITVAHHTLAVLVCTFLVAGTPLAHTAEDLFISEYGEGRDYNKWIEIFNGTGSAVDLSHYRLWKTLNGSSWPTAEFDLADTLADGDVYVICDNDADATLKAAADLELTSLAHNGDDAIGLAKTNTISGGWALIDAVGEDGYDPGTGWPVAGVNNATAEHTLVRKSTVTSGTTNWTLSAGTDTNDSQWIVYPQDTFSYVGYHGEAPQSPPSLTIDLPVTSLFVTVGSALAFDVTARDVNGDEVTLSASGLPPGAAFLPNPLIGTPPLTNTFTWTPASAAAHVVSFSAEDDDGTDSAVIVIQAVAPYAGNVWINEIHYGDVATSTNEIYEGVEIAGRSGTALSDHTLYLYNGSSLAVYDGPCDLTGSVDDEGAGYGAVWFAYPPSRIQNGPADGIALTQTEGGETNVLQFLSYEGTLVAADGPAAGWLSTDIGVQQSESTPTNLSLQVVGRGATPMDFTWTGPVTETKGRLNDGQTTVKQGTFLILR